MTYLRTLLASLILLVGACTACASGQLAALQPTSSDVISRALESSITLYDRDSDMVCAGTRVSPTYVLTAHHCAVAAVLSTDELLAMDLLGLESDDVPDTRLLDKQVKFSTYRETLAERKSSKRDKHIGVVVALDVEHDLALFRTADIGQGYVSVRDSSPQVGEDVFAIGHPAGMEYTFSRGWVSTPCRLDSRLGEGCWTQVDITIWGGSSGGGLYDMAGNLVGVASMMAKPGQAFFVPPQFVTKLLAS